jgi:hypothetical protein
MPFINRIYLTLSYLIKNNYSLLIVFNKEKEKRALILISSYFLDAKEIKEKTILFIIVLEPPFTLEN